MGKNNRFRYGLFRIDAEYYTFVSGALISIPVSLLFVMADNYKEFAYWVALFLSLVASVLCFVLSVTLKGVHEKYTNNKNGIGDTVLAWNEAIKERRCKCIILFLLTVLLLVIAIICVFAMQFIDTSEKVKEDLVGRICSYYFI